MRDIKKIIFLCAMVAFTFSLSGQERINFPRIHNAPPGINILGQLVIDPAHPMAFSLQNGNPGLYPFYDMKALINLGVSLSGDNIQSSSLFGGFRFADDFFLGFEAGGQNLPTNLKYDLSRNQYINILSDGAFGYWGKMNFGYRLLPGLALGLDAAYVSEDLEQGINSGVSAGFGLVWTNFFSNLTFSAAARNIGSQVILTDTTVNQPYVYSTGLAYNQEFGEFVLYPQALFEYSENEGGQMATSLGVSWKKLITLQFGGTFLGTVNNFPWSVGLQGRISHITLNYSIAGMNDDLAHLFSLSWEIGDLRAKMQVGPEYEQKPERKYFNAPPKAPEAVELDTTYSRVPKAPRNVRLREDGNSVVLEWDPVANGDQFLVYARLGEKSVFRKVTPDAITRFEFTFKKPSGAIVLYLYVKTQRGNFVSGPSRVVSFAAE